jgi:hypothetical protein
VSSDLLEGAETNYNLLKIQQVKHLSMVTTPKLSINHHNGNPFLTTTEKACQVHRKTKVMPIVFFYFNGVVHHKYSPQGQGVGENTCVRRLCISQKSLLQAFKQNKEKRKTT